ncbi:GNAT family N-acetyltransferase [Sphingobium sp. H39-3-25]|uniref:aminoglycoside 6'-N-acetyltransferase n=1 Tax=Sphingobium arseniciresistens TaxID=3030834 RepID=UPI0023BA0155|nr:GNAT family N-acetyltransferase [Sphingobium arseniciresistens]
MRIILPEPEHAGAWAAMRAALWPDGSQGEHLVDVTEMLSNISGGSGQLVAFIALDAAGRAVGFVEASLRHDYVNGCESSPVAFLEGLYVRPEDRRTGVGRALCAAVETWGRAHGCTELGSDAEIANQESHALHAAIGFEETERVVFFRKRL